MNPAMLPPLPASGANTLAGNAATPADGAAGSATPFARALDEARAPAPRASEPSSEQNHQATNPGTAERSADDQAGTEAKTATTRQTGATQDRTGRQRAAADCRSADTVATVGTSEARAAHAATKSSDRTAKLGSDAVADTKTHTPGDTASAAGADEAAGADGSAAAGLLAMLLAHRPVGAAAVHGGKAATTVDVPTDAVVTRGAHQARQAQAEQAQSGPLLGATTPSTSASDNAQSLSSFAGFAAELAAARREGGTREASAATQQGQALPQVSTAATAAPATGAASAAPVAEASLPLGPQHPAFATQLGAQLTTMVREGIEIARIQLHPAEMGPVTVQIQLEGSAAQVHLAAAQADTRQALDAALPTLAGALRDAGLTLAGGGVFQQPRDAQPQEQGQAAGGRVQSADGTQGRAGSTDALAAGAPATRRRGVVDLVA